jgi:uncharacterized protein YkwD
MEGRILRRQADPQAQPQIAGSGGRARSIRMTFGTAAAVITAAFVLATLMLVTASVADVGVATAKAGKCRWAHRGPRHVSRRHARHAVICQINKKRHRHGLNGVNSKHALRTAGKRHSNYMQSHHCFAHQCPGERDLVGRINATSYLPCNCYWRVGETLAWAMKGSGTPSAIVRDWMHSAPHRHVLLDGQLRNVGIGLIWGSPSNPGARAATYTADFGYKSR